MSRVMYRTKWGERIDAVEITRTTEKMVFFMRHGKEQREAKHCDWQTWHETFDEAKAHLIAKAESRVLAARRNLERENGALGNLRGLKPKEAQ